MAVDGSSVEVSSPPKSPHKLKLGYLRDRINQKVEENDQNLTMHGGNPDLQPSRNKRHVATKEAFLEYRVMIDPLTKLMGKIPFEEAERREIEATKRRDSSASPIEGILMDIDDFGKFNKDFGKTAGDEVLKKVGTTILSTIRDTDIAGRVGGEELAVMTRRTNSPERNIENAPLPAERIRQAIENIELNTGRKVTVSVGVTEYKKGEEFDVYQTRKETAQILAKRLGKNRVVEGLIIGGHEVFKDWSNNKFYTASKTPTGEITAIIEVPNG